MSTLERAIVIAAEAHSGQRDKAGAAYILHPLRIMTRMNTDDERIVAVLHDVVEDTGWTIERLRSEGFGERILEAVDAMTHRSEESYEQFVERAGRNSIARRVKLADLEDNADLSRIAEPTEKDRQRVAKYERAIAQLRGPSREFGCEQCWPDDPEAAWLATEDFVREDDVIDESHFHVSIRRCSQCSQRFVSVFTETVDYLYGDDPQCWITMPLSSSDAGALSAAKGFLSEAALRSLAPKRRSLRHDHLSGTPSTNSWDMGLRIQPHS